MKGRAVGKHDCVGADHPGYDPDSGPNAESEWNPRSSEGNLRPLAGIGQGIGRGMDRWTDRGMDQEPGQRRRKRSSAWVGGTAR